MKKKIDNLNGENQQLQMNFLALTDLKEREKTQHDQKIKKITRALEETEKYLVDHLSQTSEKLEGKRSSSSD